MEKLTRRIVQLDTGEVGYVLNESAYYATIRVSEELFSHDIVVDTDSYTIIAEYTIGYENYEVPELPTTES